jgi:tRNA(fMet)-specific endonuclease VapC
VPVLDTDTLSIIQRRIEPFYTTLAARLDALPAASVWTTVISFEEQLRGWLEYVKRAKPTQLPEGYRRLWKVNDDFNTRPVLPFDDAAAEVYIRLLRASTRVGSMDLRIAAIALARNDLLISTNLRDFRRIPGVRVEDWTRPVAR